MAQPLDPGIVQDDGGAMSVPDLDSGAGAASASGDTPADTGAANIDPGITNGGGDLGAPNIDPGITNGGGADPGAGGLGTGDLGAGDLGAGDPNGLAANTGVADTGVADTGGAGVVDQGGADQGVADQGGLDQGGADQGAADDSGGADAGSAGGAKVLLPTPGPGGGPTVAVPGDTGFNPEGATEQGADAGAAVQTAPGPDLFPHTGVPGDTGFDPEQTGGEAAQAGGANVPFIGPDLNQHTGVPGDTGIDLGDPGIAGGQAGKADTVPADDHGDTHFPGDTGINEDVTDQSGAAGAATVITPGPGGGPVQGVPGDLGFDPTQSGAEGSQAGGASVPFIGPDLNQHTGVPGDTGIDLGDPGIAGGQAGKADTVPDDDHGNTHFPGDTGINEDVTDQSGAAGAAKVTLPTPGPSGGPQAGVPGVTGEDNPAADPGGSDLGGGDAPTGVPASAVLSDLSAGGQPADTGVGDAGAAAGAAGVPGDTGAAADNPGDNSAGNPFLNDVSAGTTGDADPGQQPEGNHDIPNVDPNSAEGAGFLGGLNGGSKDAVNSAEQAQNLPDEGQSGGADVGQQPEGTHDIPDVDPNSPEGAGFLGGLNGGSKDAVNSAEQAHNLPDEGQSGGADLGQQPEGSHDIPNVDPNSAEGGGFLGGLFGGSKDAVHSAEQAQNLPDEHAGDADPGQQPEGSHDIPNVDPNSPEGGGFLAGLFGGGKDAVHSAEQAQNLPDEHAGAVDPAQSGDHGAFPILDDLAAGLTGHADPGLAGEPGAQPAAGIGGLVSSFDHILNPDPGQAASTAGGEGGAGFARDISGLTSTFDKGLSSAAEHFGQPGQGGVDPGAVGGLDHPASSAAGAAGGAGQIVNPQVGHVAYFPSHESVINDPATPRHDVVTTHHAVVDPGASGGVGETSGSNSPVPHGMPAPGAVIGDTGHHGGEEPQAYLQAAHAAAVPTETEAQPAHEGGEDNSHVAYLHPDPAQETHSTESYEHHPM